MKPEYRGEKFGEQLLKTILWYAQGNGYDLVYLTAHPDQEFLIELLQTFGFEIAQTRDNGELVIEKTMIPNERSPTSVPYCSARPPSNRHARLSSVLRG